LIAGKELYAGDVGVSTFRHRLGECGFSPVCRNIRDGIIATDTGNWVVFMNPVAERMTGYHHLGGIPPRLEEIFVLKSSSTSRGNEALYSCIMVLRDGSEISIEYCLESVLDDGGLPLGSIMIFRDVTEYQRLKEEARKTKVALEEAEKRTTHVLSANLQLIEEVKHCHSAEDKLQETNYQLRRACKAKDNFLARMSHDLRTPLNAVIGFTGTLLMKLPGPLTEDQEKQLNNISVSARHLLSIINNLLDLSRIEAGEIKAKREGFACGAFVNEIASTMVQLAENKGLRLNVRAPDPEIFIFTDRQILSRILLNFIDNAIKYSQHGEITVLVHTPVPERIEISVADSGIGIGAEDLNRLFDAFSQVDPYHSDGIGLGLHLCNILAESIGGRIAVRSQPGVGSKFTLVLEEHCGSTS
jgi:PAS domain S-box-containing protein